MISLVCSSLTPLGEKVRIPTGTSLTPNCSGFLKLEFE